jgi:hypothetical protein
VVFKSSAVCANTKNMEETVATARINRRVLDCDFLGMPLEKKQDFIERLFSSTRRKMHPLIRMDDLLDARKSSTLQNIVNDMCKHASTRKAMNPENTGTWYNIPVGLDQERHASSHEALATLLSKLQERVSSHASDLLLTGEGNSVLQWKVDLIPATNQFIVDHVINESAQFRKPRAQASSASSMPGAAARRQRPPMHHEPIFHVFVECSIPDGKVVEHMDVMYSRWAVQNPILLRQRILERMGGELLLEMQPGF